MLTLLKIYQAVQKTDQQIAALSTCTRPAGKRFHKEMFVSFALYFR